MGSGTWSHRERIHSTILVTVLTFLSRMGARCFPTLLAVHRTQMVTMSESISNDLASVNAGSATGYTSDLIS